MQSVLPGQLAYVVLVSILDAALLSWLGLLAFRRRVRTLMRASGGDASGGAIREPRRAPRQADGVPPRPEFALFDAADVPGARLRPAVAVQRRIVVTYVLAAAMHSAIMTALELGTGAERLSWVAWIARWWVNGWAMVPSLIALLVLDRASCTRVVIAYVGGGALLVSLATVVSQVLRGALDAAPFTNLYWLGLALAFTAWVPLLLILVTGWRRIRAVTPLALAGTLVFAFGAVFFRELMLNAFDVAAIRRGLLGLVAAASTETAYYGAFMLVSLPVGALAWWLLRAVASGFERKRFSDVQLIVDCWWLIVTAVEVAELSSALGIGAVVGGAAAFIAYRVSIALGLRRSPPTSSDGNRLLLLRVFGYQARTEALFDRVAQRWRFQGPVQLIAGVDLATRTIDPGDILRFLGGRLAEQYVASAEDVARHVTCFDRGRDPDGRFRVNEMYCHDDTWRPAVDALLEVSDRVLMDVRSFSERNQGCIFELERLVWQLPSDAIVLVVDHSTDLRRLGDVLDTAWQAAVEAGRARGTGRLSLVRIEDSDVRGAELLTQRLLGAGQPQRVLRAEALATVPGPDR
jgi:hypothetical protein